MSDEVVNPKSGAKFSNSHETHGVPLEVAKEQSVSRDHSRTDKAIDYLLGHYVDHRHHVFHLNGEPIMSSIADLVNLLEGTRHRHYLPSRKRLLELVEAAMPKEAGK